MSGLPVWKEREAHGQKMRTVHLRRFFAEDPGRGERLTAEAAGLYLDYSKNRIDGQTLRLLMRLADERGVRGRASRDDPHYEIQSDKSDHITAHQGSALRTSHD